MSSSSWRSFDRISADDVLAVVCPCDKGWAEAAGGSSFEGGASCDNNDDNDDGTVRRLRVGTGMSRHLFPVSLGFSSKGLGTAGLATEEDMIAGGTGDRDRARLCCC